MPIDSSELVLLLADAQRLVEVLQAVLTKDKDGSVHVTQEEIRRVKKVVFQISAKVAAASLD